MTRSCPGGRALAAAALVLALLGLAGCSKPSVHGSVSFNGEPIDDGGGIAFRPAEGGGHGATTSIAGGKYVVDPSRGLTPGKYKVEIYWHKKFGNSDADRKQIIPPKYNARTELTADITSGSNTKDFDLKP
jgi:hypothetical protein